LAGLLACGLAAAIVIPNMLTSKKTNGYPYPIISALRTIFSAQEVYYRKHGALAILKHLGDANYIDNTLAEATSPASAKSGCYFVLRLSGDSWCCTARPAQWGRTGERNFLITGEGIIYWNGKENGSEFVKVLGRD